MSLCPLDKSPLMQNYSPLLRIDTLVNSNQNKVFGIWGGWVSVVYKCVVYWCCKNIYVYAF